jgi:hypothetical protein
MIVLVLFVALLLTACGAEAGTAIVEDALSAPGEGETPTAQPEPTTEPTAAAEPTAEPTATTEPTAEPTATTEPTAEPTATTEPTAEPTATTEPTATAEPAATAILQVQPLPPGVAYSDYVEISDDSGTLKVTVPIEWADINGAAWVRDDEEVGFAVSASSDLAAYNNSWTTPGTFFGASTSLTAQHDPGSLLDTIDLSGNCTYDGRLEYANPLYAGMYDLYTNCGGEGSTFVNLAVIPPYGSALLMVQVQLVSDADLEALNRILDSFTFTAP